MWMKLLRIALLSAVGFGAVYWFLDTKVVTGSAETPVLTKYWDEETRTYASMDYFLLKPVGYDPQKSYPLVISLHGGDMPDEGSGPTSSRFTGVYGLDAVQADHPCFVLIPQAPRQWWAGGRRTALVTEIKRYIDQELTKEFPIDSSRLYAIGYSAGGTGLFHMMAWHPDYLAAAIPLAGWLTPKETTRRLIGSHTAVWSFSGTDDPCAAWWATEALLEAYQRWSGNFKLTVLKQGDHGAPIRAYTALCNGEPIPGESELIVTSSACDVGEGSPLEWMFRQRLR
jgi:predicted peptidase